MGRLIEEGVLARTRRAVVATSDPGSYPATQRRRENEGDRGHPRMPFLVSRARSFPKCLDPLDVDALRSLSRALLLSGCASVCFG